MDTGVGLPPFFGGVLPHIRNMIHSSFTFSLLILFLWCVIGGRTQNNEKTLWYRKSGCEPLYKGTWFLLLQNSVSAPGYWFLPDIHSVDAHLSEQIIIHEWLIRTLAEGYTVLGRWADPIH